MSRFLPRVLVLTVALLALPGALRADEAPASSEERLPMLWVVEGEVPAYLLGTIHVADPRVLDLPDVVTQAFASSDVYFGELDMSPGTRSSAQRLMMLPEGKSLRALVGEETWGKLAPLMVEGGIPEMVLARLKVWVAAMRLLAQAMTPEPAEADTETDADTAPEAGSDPETSDGEAEPDESPDTPLEPMDAVLYRNAAAQGKTTGGLETLAEQVSVFDAMSAEDQLTMLRDLLDVVEVRASEDDDSSSGKPDAEPDVESEAAEAKVEALESQYEALVTHYLAGDAEGLVRIVQAMVAQESETLKTFMTRLFDERNVRMADRILEKRAENPGKVHFFAVGAGHYGGHNGILALLRAKGETVRRVTMDEQVPERVKEPAGAR